MTTEEHYKNNKEIKEYIDRFAKHRNISVEEAFKHIIVQEYTRFKLKGNE